VKLSERKSFALAVALGAFALVGGTGLTVSSAWLITMAAQHPPVLVLSVAIVLVRFFGIFRSVARYGERVISHEAIFRKLTGVRAQLFTAFASRLRDKGNEISSHSKAAVDDVERAQEFHLRVTLPGLYATFSGAVTLLIAAWIGRYVFLWVGLATLIFAIAIPILVTRYLDPISNEIEIQENLFAHEISDAAHAQREAAHFGYLSHFQNKLKNTAEQLHLLEKKFHFRASLLQLVTVATTAVALIGISISASQKGELLPIQISMAIFIALIGFEGYTTWFPSLFPAGKNRRAAQTVRELSIAARGSDRKSEELDGIGIRAVGLIPYWEERFISPVTFEVNPGETLVVTGASGVGKSTLAAAILGFAHYSGSITIGGVQARAISDPYRYFSATLQQGYIFNTTLRENLKIAREDISDQELLTILHALELDAIGLDEVLGEYGRAISGGEAKRVAVARALISTAPIVILDEPLEHLDHERAIRIQGEISRIAAGRTLIVITHAPWLQYSRKLVLERE
jgi:ABC-type transport system involved in cytochrome bd biosynthesis fused ATPase/permease subunit